MQTPMKVRLIELINQYLKTATTYTKSLENQFNGINILEAVNSAGMPRKGELKDFRGGHYSVHGSGCFIEAQGIEIDFDFGPGGTIPGFDPRKLYDFALNQRSVYDWIPDEVTKFEQLIVELTSEGILRPHGEYPTPNLLCLRDLPGPSSAPGLDEHR